MAKNKKALAIVMLIFLTTCLTNGCGFTNTPPEQEPPPASEGTALEYKVITDTERLPVEVKSLAGTVKSCGYFVFTPQQYATAGDTYLLISAGTKPTGGYTIALGSCAVTDDILEIVVEEKEPAADEGVVQVITVPHLILKINSNFQDYNIKNNKNESYTAIPAAEMPEIVEKKGTYVGQIDNNFIEMEIGNQAQAFMFEPELDSFIETFKAGDEILFSCYENNYGQQIITNFKIE
ncbi:MAG: protease complex subunit PrcB family protein [Firmicutes bacterium]|nr:protease complex subunit PrcB family protein [Bacillota bacterium]